MLLVCTTNKGKRIEFKTEFERYGILNVSWIQDKGIEVQGSLEEVAMNAAAWLYVKYKKPLIVEDAGLFIRSLKRFPGPYSSYVMKTIGYQGILKLMEGIEDRYAEFRSVIAYADENGIKLFVGTSSGRISYSPRGSSGFGFDPIFIPEGSNKTFAEMNVHEKNKYSHRAKALNSFISWRLEK